MKQFLWIDLPVLRRRRLSSIDRYVFARSEPVALTRLGRLLPSLRNVALWAQLEAKVALHQKILERASSFAPFTIKNAENTA